MRLKTLLNKTKEGETLKDNEVRILAEKLELVYSVPKLFFKIVLSVALLAVAIYCFIKIEHLVVNLIVSILVLILILLIFLVNNSTKNTLKYLEALKEFYINRLSNFEGFENFFVQHQYQRNGYLQNWLAIILTNGKDFYIFDDFFEETEYVLPRNFKSANNKRPVLKIIDREFVNKRPIFFKSSEINYFQLLKPDNTTLTEKEKYGYEYRRFTFSPIKYELDNYCYLELTDGSVFRFSPDAVLFFRKKATTKERT